MILYFKKSQIPNSKFQIPKGNASGTWVLGLGIWDLGFLNAKIYFIRSIVLTFLTLFITTSCQKTKISGYDVSSIYKPDSVKDPDFFNRVQVNEYFYPYKKTNEDYEEAGKKLKNPLLLTLENTAKGKAVYLEYCKQCHGLTGISDAPMITRNKFPPPPNYAKRIRTITQGKMFHSLTWGKNLMPSFREELTPDKRWMVIYYVRQLANIKDTIK